jgi:hypothetical protein
VSGRSVAEMTAETWGDAATGGQAAHEEAWWPAAGWCVTAGAPHPGAAWVLPSPAWVLEEEQEDPPRAASPPSAADSATCSSEVVPRSSSTVLVNEKIYMYKRIYFCLFIFVSVKKYFWLWNVTDCQLFLWCDRQKWANVKFAFSLYLAVSWAYFSSVVKNSQTLICKFEEKQPGVIYIVIGGGTDRLLPTIIQPIIWNRDYYASTYQGATSRNPS